jgi:hypothetical protein
MPGSGTAHAACTVSVCAVIRTTARNVGGRLRTRIRTDAEANAHGDFEQLLGAFLALGGLIWLVVYAVGF